jgi:hypothetical protein
MEGQIIYISIMSYRLGDSSVGFDTKLTSNSSPRQVCVTNHHEPIETGVEQNHDAKISR